ncbi:MAG: sulfur oxidation c-type cytochrome SoxX [Gammaproteobacteria bacterium]|nr:sulfur oxidation c-type cytochrome SoxX [Gammaproteobacteria bacterium]MDH5692812.1 sulfur oxidation c-type cytochrome SoxX [Gammaproteobacteria bacterium]
MKFRVDFSTATPIAVLIISLIFSILVPSIAFAGDEEQGKAIAFDRKKGNCLACHAIEGGSLPGNIGPPLENMKNRYPDKAKLRDQIFDATKRNPNSIMPPFGKHEILTKDELDKVVEFIYTL